MTYSALHRGATGTSTRTRQPAISRWSAYQMCSRKLSRIWRTLRSCILVSVRTHQSYGAEVDVSGLDGVDAVPLSVHVIGDLDSDDGLQFVKEALESIVSTRASISSWRRAHPFYQTSESAARVSFIHSPSSPSALLEKSIRRTSSLVSHMLSGQGLQTTTPTRLLAALGFGSVTPADVGEQTVLTQQSALEELMGGVALEDVDVPSYQRYVEASRAVVTELGLSPGEHGLLVNGRVCGQAFRPLDVGINLVRVGPWPACAWRVRRAGLQDARRL